MTLNDVSLIFGLDELPIDFMTSSPFAMSSIDTAELLPFNDVTSSMNDNNNNSNVSLIKETTSAMNVSTDFTLRAVRLTINVYVVGMLSLLGILGNLMSTIVLGRDQSIRKTTRFLLQMLAVSDGVYLVACVFYQTLKTVSDSTEWFPEVIQTSWPVVEQIVWPCASVAQTCTVWLVVIVTADRYIAICCPLQAPQYSTSARTKSVIFSY